MEMEKDKFELLKKLSKDDIDRTRRTYNALAYVISNNNEFQEMSKRDVLDIMREIEYAMYDVGLPVTVVNDIYEIVFKELEG